MFGKKGHVDIKKSSLKVLDAKRDSLSRCKHLRVLLDNWDTSEAKNFFEFHYSSIYFIFFDTFINLETGLKHRGQKQAREELDSVLYILEKVLILLPELVKRRWQHHSIGVMMRKMLHPGNSLKVRQEGMRLFLIWFQILGEASATELEPIFGCLVPGIIPGLANPFLFPTSSSSNDGNVQRESTFYPESPLELSATRTPQSGAEHGSLPGNSFSAIQPIEIEPLIPVNASELQPKDLTGYYLQCLMDYIVSQVTRVYWKEQKESRQLTCFEFLFEEFKRVYLPHIFPRLDPSFSLYKPTFELPMLRTSLEEEDLSDELQVKRFASRDSLVNAKAVVIRWLAKYMSNEVELVPRRNSYSEAHHPSNKFVTQMSVTSANEHYTSEWREPTPFEFDVVRTTLNSRRANVNLVHELFRQAFLLPFSQALTMRRVVAVYKDWINKTSSDVPLFMEEPLNGCDGEHGDVRAGLSKVIRAFITSAANIFLLQIPPEKPLLLEEQVDMCKRVLNIYRFMVMKVDMDRETWEQLLQVMLQITSLVLTKAVPIRKEDTLGGRLAPAFFQTLIVTWIRANLNVCIPMRLWETFQKTLSSLTQWEELVKEWSKTMDTITRVMSRYVYNINLQDLPLDRLNERRDRRRKTLKPMPQGEVKLFPQKVDSEDSPQKQFMRRQESLENNRRRSNSGESNNHSSKASPTSSRPANVSVSRSVSDSHLLAQIWQNQLRETKAGSNRKNSPKSKSLEFVCQRIDSPCFSESSESHSRSPSPTPSSGIDSSSLKDSPLNLEGGAPSTSSSTAKGVMVGGTYRGWTSDSAVVLWKRMLGVLGDVNSLSDPSIHAQVMECLAKVVDDLIKVRDNLGVATEQHPIAVAPSLIPPLHVFVPWLFKSFQLNDDYKPGKLVAYKLLSVITLRRHDVQPSQDFLCLFYRCIAAGVMSQDMDVISTIIKNSGGKLFSMGLPGSTCLLHVLVDAANAVLTSETKGLPRFEAISLLGALIGMNNFYKEVNSLQTGSAEPKETHCKDLKEQILNLLIKGSKKEPSVAFNCLGLFLYQELENRSNHPRLLEITNLLVAGTRHSNKVLSRIACDMLRLQSDHSTYLLDSHPEIPRKIIEGLASSLAVHVNTARTQNMFKDYKDILLTTTFCLGEWVMSVPAIFLKCTPPSDGSSGSLLLTVLRVLTSVIKGKDLINTNRANFEGESDFNAFSDSFRDYSASPNVSPRKRPFFNLGANDEANKGNEVSVIGLAAKMLLGYLLNYLGHFPYPCLGAARLSCYINENDDNASFTKNEEKDELTSDIFNAPNVLFFVVNDSSIVSFIEISEGNKEERYSLEGPKNKSPVRVIIRDLIGKFAWDCNPISATTEAKPSPGNGLSFESHKSVSKPSANHSEHYREEEENSPSFRADPLDSLLQYIGHSSPECVATKRRQHLNAPVPANNVFTAQTEENMIALLLNQHYQEMNYMEQYGNEKVVIIRNGSEPNFRSVPKSPNALEPQSTFFNCRQLIDQLGFLFWEKRAKVELLGKNDKVLRELRNLDNQKCRETHKIAVIYVAEGQEDKNSILLNQVGSKAFEEFVSGLGWEVDLEKHLGFRGGLQKNKSTGATAPYFATAFMEVVFHVSTRIPATEEEGDSLTRKLRHLGNDEVHIVWSEHWRDYRRGIIPTEFCDVLIVIYPVLSLPYYYRVYISRKPDVPFFGPLYNGSMVHANVLAGLVRATAINASRAQRLHVPFYQNFFEERARSLDTIVNCQEKKCFEDFAAAVYSPAQLGLLSSRPVSSLSGMTTSVGETYSISSNQSGLGYNDPHQSPKTRNRPFSMSSVDQRLSPKLAPPQSAKERPLSALSTTTSPATGSPLLTS